MRGCQSLFRPSHSTPVVPLPVYLAAPVILTAQAIDDYSPARSNADFILAGEVIDDRGRPVDSVEAEIVTWVATLKHTPT